MPKPSFFSTLDRPMGEFKGKRKKRMVFNNVSQKIFSFSPRKKSKSESSVSIPLPTTSTPLTQKCWKCNGYSLHIIYVWNAIKCAIWSCCMYYQTEFTRSLFYAFLFNGLSCTIRTLSPIKYELYGPIRTSIIHYVEI